MTTLRELLEEGEVVDLEAVRAKKMAQAKAKRLHAYEEVIRPFVSSWDRSVAKLHDLPLFLDMEEEEHIMTLLRRYERAALNLSVALRGKRAKMSR